MRQPFANALNKDTVLRRFEKKKKINIFILLALIVGGSLSMYYLYQLYQRISIARGDMFLRLERRAGVFEKKYQSQPMAYQEHFRYIQESQSLVKKAIDRDTTKSYPYYYQATFYFYEIILRTSIDLKSLYEILSRSFIPPPRNALQFGEKAEKESEAINLSENQRKQEKQLVDLGEKLLHGVNKVFALGDSDINVNQGQIFFLIGKLLYTGRIDQHDLKRIQSISSYTPQSPISSYYLTWLRIVYYAYFQDRSFDFAQEIKKLEISSSWEKPIAPFVDWQMILLAQIYFKLKKYNHAYDIAQKLTSQAGISPYFQQEAHLLKAQILYVQRSKEVALPYLEKAYEFSQFQDTYIKKYLEEWKQ